MFGNKTANLNENVLLLTVGFCCCAAEVSEAFLCLQQVEKEKKKAKRPGPWLKSQARNFLHAAHLTFKMCNRQFCSSFKNAVVYNMCVVVLDHYFCACCEIVMLQYLQHFI